MNQEQQNSQKKKKQSFKISTNNRDYRIKIQIINNQLKFTIITYQSPQKWLEILSMEQIYNLHPIFQVCNSEQAYQYFYNIFQKKEFKIQIQDQNAILSFDGEYFKIKVKFDIVLSQVEFNTKEAVEEQYQAIQKLKKSNKELKKNFQELQQRNKTQGLQQRNNTFFIFKGIGLNISTFIKFSILVIFILLINKFMQEKILFPLQPRYEQQFYQIDERIQKLNQIISQLERKASNQENKISILQQQLQEYQSKPNQNQMTTSLILTSENIQKLSKQIYQSNKQLNLKLLYRATIHGFDINTFYEKTLIKSPTLIVIQTTENKRFGGYTKLEWRKGSGCIRSFDDQTFIFSLDQNKKYILERQDVCSIFSTQQNFGFGSTDIVIADFPNKNTNSFSKMAGFERYDNAQYLAGRKNFVVEEIEVFHVI